MKSTIANAAALLSLTTTIAAQTTQSKPFTLSLQSTNATLNGKTLTSCHEGAAIEGLCIGPYAASQYQWNTTDGQVVSDKNLGKSGVLTWELVGGNFKTSEPMVFVYNPSTNVAHAQFSPSDQNVQVGFDKNNKMFVPTYYDDTVSPPKQGNERALYHWYICNYAYAAYAYESLNFVVGNAKPQNPSCQKVDVVRKFVK
ncbi:hypothetical protein CKM354_000119900 [Cercospora kikuchii]|uniref:DUF7907 domain-containing protein n=1 Tax=Cercospora kikuchii TaxID=84275 RepID=A0A9P3C7K5_9PEZI|nr:uncharacterized protein CKM354_000119900 [Cercospora kikuchii]GIZ37763.1 hypothetical protein CKM354_000119900 [Cercospora kikuchii]